MSKIALLWAALGLVAPVVPAQYPQLTHELTAFDAAFRAGARYSLSMLPETGGANQVRVVCFRPDDPNKFFWLDFTLGEKAITRLHEKAEPRRVELNTGTTCLGMVRYWPAKQSFLVAGSKERSGRLDGTHAHWSHLAFFEHDSAGGVVRRFLASTATMAGHHLLLASTDLRTGQHGEVCLTGFAQPLAGQALHPELAGIETLPLYFDFGPDGSLRNPVDRATLASTFEGEPGTGYLGIGITPPSEQPPVLLVQRVSRDPSAHPRCEISLLALGHPRDQRVVLDFDLPADPKRSHPTPEILGTAFAIDRSGAGVVVAGPHVFEFKSEGVRSASVASLRIVKFDPVSGEQRHYDLPASAIDKSGELPVVHDLAVLGAPGSEISLVLVVTVGGTTSLLYLLTL